MKNINTNQLVPYYLMSSFLYYSAHPQWVSPLNDIEYDNLCKRLLDEWDSIEHPHKYLIDFESLSSGTGYYLKQDDYPSIVIGAAINWAESYTIY